MNNSEHKNDIKECQNANVSQSISLQQQSDITNEVEPVQNINADKNYIIVDKMLASVTNTKQNNKDDMHSF